MGCKSCSSGSCGTKNKEDGTKVGGCQNNGACGTGGCNKMNVFDWLSNMDVPTFSKFNIVEVKFKGGRKEYFRNTNQVELYAGDPVIVDVPSGHHLGFVSLQGELVRLQMLKKGIKDNDEIKAIYRKANDKDLEKHEQAVARDYPTMYRTREIIKELKLNMKLSDVEFQSDNTKAIFYYSSDDRVDFRELIKTLAGEFKVRIEMKQISLRQEAARVGGIGVCGRELCCSTWLTDFKNVTTSAARYQNLSLNPVKLSGQCGRLKCCLNYELETYMDALKDIPTIEKPLQTLKGDAFLQKTDIFKRVMWFGYRGEESNWIPVSVDRVREILNMNESGQKPQTIDGAESAKIELELEKGSGPLNADLDKMDKKYGGGNKKRFDKNKSDRTDFKQERKDSPRPERKDFKKDNQRPERKDFKQERRDVKADNKPQNAEKPVNQAGNKPQGEQQKGNHQPRQQGQKGNKQHNARPQNQQGNGEGQQPKPQNQQRQQGNNGEGQQPKPQNQQRQQGNNGEGQQPKPQNQQRQQGNGEGQQPKPQNQQRQQGQQPNGDGQQQPKPQNQQRPNNGKQQGNKPPQNQQRPQNQQNGGNKGPKPNNRPPENKGDGQA
ncbi:PSP1-like protein [Arcicella aurantiaca]|uniref:PSP1-like protein n=1 Tax=Arcicella aurantiaca TaxID=591202 RepID=A0A316ECK8_9BACT|nr:regulatory iron-sulfur-containing complex subunit RicT [Arcicella aurantiaca]PWK27389.1 PSP1-like protein [Arcicella aurantiaca]